MTAVTATPPEGRRRLFGLLGPKPARIPVNGKPIRARGLQQLVHGSLFGVLGVCLFAGVYFAVIEVPWHIWVHIGSFQWRTGTSLIKHWWDGGMGFIHSGDWYLYRHAIRNDGEPAAFALFGSMIAAPPKYWGRKIGTLRLIATPPLLLLATLALIVGGTWVIIHWLPANWSYSACSLVLGLAIGFAMRPLWKPAGATLQGFLVDRAVDVSRAKGRDPLWERTPLGPPSPRERYSEMKANDTDTETRSPASRGVIITILIAAFLLVVLGALAKFGFAHGLHVPYLYPAH
jgi:hypothetical protein